MAMRIGFEIEGAGLAGVGITMGYFAVEDMGARERQLFKLVHLGGEGPALVYGFVETLSPRGTWLPTQGDIGTVPPLITMSNRMIGITLESGWGYNIPATLAIEFGPYYGQSGDLVYKKENLVVWVSNIVVTGFFPLLYGALRRCASHCILWLSSPL
jgi:hypothetical protein